MCPKHCGRSSLQQMIRMCMRSKVQGTHEEPSNTLELASSIGGSTGLVVEKQPQQLQSTACKHKSLCNTEWILTGSREELQHAITCHNMWQSVATKHFWSNTRPQVGTHGCNARACGKHNDVGLRVLWQQHLCTGGACDEHLVSWCHVLG
jgi:hypothetical protein